MSKRDDPQLRVRIPQELKEALEKIAAKNDRTLTAEINRRLKGSLEDEGVIFSGS
ncbi:Arc family DNA-binding protein [Erwinia psidii]|uniref:Arc family DNA-binding protein n=1 Tax=Erwinia psidii TaxID=69224 RepID=UPI00226B6188|nr:Arc family DNA-binding protein [Erwinia psidii]MCX8963221.1 Arc family DNA-binding protein [Erwinia psidii]